jgi:hypothetical protein
MANFYGTSRSNYFRVRNEVLFKGWVEMRGLQLLDKQYMDAEGHPTEKFWGIAPGSSSEDGCWPSYEFNVYNAEVSGRIMSGIDGTTVKQVDIDLRIREREVGEEDAEEAEARQLYQEHLETLLEWDPRIQPYTKVDNINITTEDYEIDIVAELTNHLADGEVAVLISVGNEKLRYIDGRAIAVNNKGEERRIDLGDIYELAAELGSHVTEAVY